MRARNAGPISQAIERTPARTSTAAPAPSSMTSARGITGRRHRSRCIGVSEDVAGGTSVVPRDAGAGTCASATGVAMGATVGAVREPAAHPGMVEMTGREPCTPVVQPRRMRRGEPLSPTLEPWLVCLWALSARNGNGQAQKRPADGGTAEEYREGAAPPPYPSEQRRG